MKPRLSTFAFPLALGVATTCAPIDDDPSKDGLKLWEKEAISSCDSLKTESKAQDCRGHIKRVLLGMEVLRDGMF